MTQDLSATVADRQSLLSPPEVPGEGQHPNKLQGHWVLARVGKRVLRPGGIELTRQMLEVLDIGPQDRVVEFAPGLGVTARMVLKERPLSYWGVEREPAIARRLQRRFSRNTTKIVQGRAEESGLPTGCATVVFGEALLSMQTQQQKNRIIAEACRLLITGGRFAIHELCLLPDDISDGLRREIQAAMSSEIHVGVQPLCRNEWITMLKQNGLSPAWSGEAPMHLLEPQRLLQDEGIVGGVRIAFRMAANPELSRRVLIMRRLFHDYGSHLGAISLVCRKEPAAASSKPEDISAHSFGPQGTPLETPVIA